MTGATLSQSGGEIVFATRGQSKVYRTGDVETHALRGVDLGPYAMACGSRPNCEIADPGVLNRG